MPTANPVPSYDPTDLIFNAEKLDEVVNGTSATYTDRRGVQRRTLAGLEAEFPNAQANAATAESAAAASADSAVDAANEAASAATAVVLAFNEATAAQTARTGAEAARDAALIQAGVFVDEPTGRAAMLDGQAFKVQGAGDVAAYEYRRVNASGSTLIAKYPSIQAYNKAVSNSFAPANFTDNEVACVKCIEYVEVTRFTGFTNNISLLKLATNSSGKPTEVNFFYFAGSNQFIICSKESEDLINGYETWAGEINNLVRVSARVNVKKTPPSFIYSDADFSTNNMRVQQYIDAAERKSVLFSNLYHQYVEFTEAGVYDASGNVTTAYGGYHKALDINKTGFYQIGWTLAGAVRCMHAVNAAGAILASWKGDYFANARNKTIDVPAGATRLLLSSYSDLPFNSSNQKDGFLIHTPKADGANYGIVSEDRINGLIKDARTDDAPYIEIYGNIWTDGAWRNSHDKNSIARVYPLNSGETYEILCAPDSSLVVPEQTISSKSITAQLASYESFAPITHNGALFNNLGEDCDSVTVNGYTRKGYIAATWTPPAGAKSLIVQVQYGAGNALPGIRLFKRKGAKGPYAKNNNANKKIAVCGDSVAANPWGDIGKERLRDSLGCVVHTYAVPGAGFSYNATPTWVTPNRVSGVMQVEELVKAATPAYDIYLLSGTLNDPVTHEKAIGSITHCRPYLKVNGLPDFSDPNLDTMLGALNFCIQRIYEKNPKAKIVLSTMGKIFLTLPKSGFDTDAGYNMNDTSTNAHGSTYYDYVKALRLLGESWGIPVVDIYAKAGINEFNKAATMSDAYHPTQRGYEGIWNLWFDAVAGA